MFGYLYIYWVITFVFNFCVLKKTNKFKQEFGIIFEINTEYDCQTIKFDYVPFLLDSFYIKVILLLEETKQILLCFYRVLLFSQIKESGFFHIS